MSTCLLCCQQSQYFVLPPCNHKNVCWRCCIKLVQGNIFSCPFCKNVPQERSMILFVNESQMHESTFSEIIQKGPYRSHKNTYFFYSNENVAKFLEQGTSNSCSICLQIFENLNLLKKHLSQTHRRQFCEVCLDNRKCLINQQILYNEVQLNSHLKQGQYSQHGQLILYHPYCDFCKIRFYDADVFRYHLKASSHIKCDLCQNNTTKFQNVYYRNYEEIQKHFLKSHFICQIGACIGKKFQNVFISEQALQDHKLKAHKKHKNGQKKQKQVVNLVLFNKQEQSIQQWDKIGKDFSKQFSILNKTFKLQKQQHKDLIIDIRDFYPEMIKSTHKLTFDQIINKYNQVISRYGYKKEEININMIDMFRPLEMTSSTRVQLEKFLQYIFQPKFIQPIITLFFTQRNQYKDYNAFFMEIKRKMCQFSQLAYYYSFPQLIRFMKDQNHLKRPMDEFYAQSLHSLKVNRHFIFHYHQRYGDLLILMRQLIQKVIERKSNQKAIDIELYKQYLKNMNISLFNENYEKIFYVQKDKILNLYHMIDKCKTQDMIKFNWLLKVGLSKSCYDIITRKFFYKDIQDCGEFLQNFTIQEYALLYSYITICLEALFEKNKFNQKKISGKPLFLSDIFKKIDHGLTKGIILEIQQAQQNSIKIQVKYKQKKNKGVIINETDYPALWSPADSNLTNKKKPQQNSWNLIATRPLPVKVWNQQQSIKKKKGIIKQNQNQLQEEFPSILANATQKGKNKIRKKQQQEKQANDQFPVYNFRQKYVTKKQPPNLDLGYMKQGSFIKKWDQEQSKKKNRNKIQEKKNQNYIWNQQDQDLKKALDQSMISFKQQSIVKSKKQDNNNQQIQSKKKYKKKQKNIKIEKEEEEERQRQNSRQLYVPQNLVIKKLENDDSQIMIYQIPKKSIKARFDMSSSQDEKQKKKQQQEKNQKPKPFNLYDQDDFQPIGGGQKQSIVNRIINNQKKEEQQTMKFVKKNKKGKKEIIERVNINDL